jgi:hypothetical protein
MQAVETLVHTRSRHHEPCHNDETLHSLGLELLPTPCNN